MLPILLEINRRLSHPLYPWNRHCTVLLGHAVVDATEAWLEPTDNRAHNRVVSTEETTLEPQEAITREQSKSSRLPIVRCRRPFYP
jgi:hypothetical protein